MNIVSKISKMHFQKNIYINILYLHYLFHCLYLFYTIHFELMKCILIYLTNKCYLLDLFTFDPSFQSVSKFEGLSKTWHISKFITDLTKDHAYALSITNKHYLLIKSIFCQQENSILHS